MDIFPTLLSMAGLKPPVDRRYDGIDATDVLLNGDQTGREVHAHTRTHKHIRTHTHTQMILR